MRVSVVVPTFARRESLSRAVETLVASDRSILGHIELLVVDDGSPVDVEPIVEGVRRRSEVPITLIRQSNAGPASARNRGFRAASGDIVLFVDDDIEVPPGLVAAHVAAHRQHPGSVIFGRCVLPDSGDDRLLLRVLDGLGGDAGTCSKEDIEPSELVASGQLSVPRERFINSHRVYRDDLRTPGAEEYELSFRLCRLGIPILRANRITAVHRTELSLARVCQGQYTHGRGCAEAAAKAPETLALPSLKRILCHPRDSQYSPAAVLKRAGSSPVARRLLLHAGQLTRPVLGHHPMVALLYRWAIGAHFMAGVREGSRAFSTSGRTSRLEVA